MYKRTDMADECITPDYEKSGGVRRIKRGKVFDITEININDDSLFESMGKRKGRYITLEYKNLGDFSDEETEMIYELAEEFENIIPDGDILVCGLGNRDITPDAIGPLTAAKILATRHLRDELGRQDSFLKSLRRVSVFAGGVLGQTGIETAEIISALCRQIKPSAVVAADALACSDINRLGRSIQITDTGISPGSGVENSRKEISSHSLGIPVIAVGVPTVADLRNITESTDKNCDMVVTPRNIDRLAERSAQLIAFALNRAFHPMLNMEEIRSLF
ncbi:MAG: GPR endopeptidase [Ruminococcus sp.]|nr:GPR endopeptidase [Ruminococcus sp.]